jgi:non-specific serine/threonine protein kinase
LERARGLLDGGARLVTLTGPGGSGKTTLALALVDQLSSTYRDGSAIVELAPVHEAELVPAAVAQSVGLRESVGARVEEGLAAFLARRELLLCLDNFEHLLDAAPLVSQLLSQAPGLTVIATSRAPLRVRDEQELPVPPLPPTEAEALFTRRASQVRPDLALENGARDAVAEICRRLDGLPLAIELAAARVRALTPEQLLDRLEQRLPLLTGGPRDAPERQRTLRATIEWSHELLSEPERTLFARLSVFAGGCTVEAAETACDADVDTLTALVEHNLLRPDGSGGGRYTMLETIREYAAERLDESGAADAVHARHAEFFLALADEAKGGIYGGPQLDWLDRLDAELPNIRGALAWCIDGGRAADALRLCAAVWTFWEARRPSDGRRWLDAGLAAHAAVPPEIRARALFAYGHLLLFAGELTRARELLETAAALCRELHDPDGLVLALARLSWVVLEQGHLDESGALAAEGLVVIERVGERWVRAEALNYFGTAVAETDAARGCELLEEARALWTELGNVQRSADVLNNLGWTTILTGEYARSRGYHEENLRVARGNKDTFRISMALGNLGLVELLDGHPERVPPLLAEELPFILERGERRTFPEAAVMAASVAASAGDTIRAARLGGAAEAAYETTGGAWSQPEQQLLDRYVLPLRGEAAEEFDAAWAEGRGLSFEDAIAYALDGLAPSQREAEPLALGEGGSLAGYVLDEVVGRGGMGVVWRARQVSLDRLVAIKLIAPDQSGNTSFRERFLREAQLAASLEHPHVLPVYEAGESEGRLFLAIRYVEGEDLASLLAREGPLEPVRAVGLLAQIASALDAAHARGLVHRDVKPANVLVVTQEGSEHAYLTDFGIAKSSATDTAGLTAAGQLLGTVDYLAPESIQHGRATAASDVYALACVLYELLTGSTPFPRETDVATIWAHVQDEPPHLRDGFPEALDAVVRRGLAKEPGERFEHAGDLASAAHAALAGQGKETAPPPAPVDSWPEALPRPTTPLIGRERELAELAGALAGADGGVLSITGPGGSGKTRLMLELAARAARRFRDGVRFAPLASIEEPALVASALARTLGLRDSGDRAPEELIEQRLREDELLLCVDNLEHLIPSVTPLFARFAAVASRSTLVVTSRTRLGISREREYPIDPLPTPEAAALFTARARAVKPSLEVDDEAAAVVVSICRRLDGLPLAIELAAARVRLMSPKAILARLDERLRLLTGGPADAPARQQTLRATIDWSYGLLEREQQRLLACLSGFPGGARLDAVEAVCDGDLDSLDALVRHSLVGSRDDFDGEPRFSMLETIREYAADRLEASGDAEGLLRARSGYLLRLVEQVNLRGHDQVDWLARLDAEHDNIRASLAWSLEHEADVAARVAAVMWEYWWARGHLREGRDTLARVIAATSETSVARAAAMLGDANLARDLGHDEEGMEICREAVKLLEELDGREWLAEALVVLGAFESWLGVEVVGREHIDRALTMAREDGNDFVVGNALSNLGWLEVRTGRMARAAQLLEEAVAAWERAGNAWGIAIAENNRGCALVSLGDVDGAERLLRRSAPVLAELGMPWLLCAVLDELAISVARARGDLRRAACLLGARDRLAAELGATPTWFTDEEAAADLRESLSASAFDVAYAEGRAMTLEEAVACAVGREPEGAMRRSSAS